MPSYPGGAPPREQPFYAPHMPPWVDPSLAPLHPSMGPVPPHGFGFGAPPVFGQHHPHWGPYNMATGHMGPTSEAAGPPLGVVATTAA